MSTKGQVILPKAIRERRNWDVGARLIVEDTDQGVLLTRAPAFAPTRPEQVFGMLPKPRMPVSLDEMEAAVRARARRGA